MNKSELLTAIKESHPGITKKDAGIILDAILGTIGDMLAHGEKVTLVDFGTFEARDRNERQGVNPSTGEKMAIPATRVPGFKAGKALKEKVAG